MSKKDNFATILMTHRNVNLQCDDEKLQLRYRSVEGKPYGVWFCNEKDTGLQVTGLVRMLKVKYENIKVIWKRQF